MRDFSILQERLMNMEERFLTFVAKLFNVDRANVSLDTEYMSLPEWDSLMQLRLVMEVEAEFSCEIPIDEVPNLNTLRKFYEYVE